MMLMCAFVVCFEIYLSVQCNGEGEMIFKIYQTWPRGAPFQNQVPHKGVPSIMYVLNPYMPQSGCLQPYVFGTLRSCVGFA